MSKTFIPFFQRRETILFRTSASRNARSGHNLLRVTRRERRPSQPEQVPRERPRHILRLRHPRLPGSSEHFRVTGWANPSRTFSKSSEQQQQRGRKAGRPPDLLLDHVGNVSTSTAGSDGKAGYHHPINRYICLNSFLPDLPHLLENL